MVIERVQQMSVEAFLDFAESSEDWHEFIDGEPYKMTGGLLGHFDIISNIIFEFRVRLAETDCRTLPNGMLVRAGEANLVAPDVSVVCGEAATEHHTQVLLNPVLVVEVTSPTSIERDRNLKRDLYWAVESIQAYLVIDQHRPLVDLYARGETDWTLRRFSDMGDEIPLEALDCSLPLREIYRRIDFEAEAPGAEDG